MNRKPGILQENIKKILERANDELLAIKGNLLSSAKGKGIKTILVTSSKPAEGKTVSAINLALGLCKTDARVALLDGNLHHPCLHKMFNLNNSFGLSEFFTSNSEFSDEILMETEYERLFVMPGGVLTEQSADIFRTESFGNRLDLIKQNLDYVILDGPSILSSSEVQLIANRFDGIIMVIECEKTKWEVVKQAKVKLNNVGGEILGVVMNKRRYYIPEKLYK